MSDRFQETYDITTPNGHGVTLRKDITGREYQTIQAALGQSVRMEKTDAGVTVMGSGSDPAAEVAFQIVVRAVKLAHEAEPRTKPDTIVTAILDEMSAVDYQAIEREVQAVVFGKKNRSTPTTSSNTPTTG